MKLLPLLFVVFIAFSCSENSTCEHCSDCTDYLEISDQTALVESKNGLQVFIMSEPKRAYSDLETLNNDLLSDVMENSKGKKKFGQVLKGIVEASTNYLSLNQIVTNMCNEAKEKHPKADGIIFMDNLSKAKVIQFKSKTEN